MALTPAAVHTSRLIALFAASALTFLASATTAFGATIAFSTPAQNATISQGTVGTVYSGPTFQTNCTSAAGTGYTGTWSISGAPAGITRNKANNADGSGNNTLTGTPTAIGNSTAVTLTFTRDASGGNLPCDASTSVSRIVTLPVVYKYAASSFGVQPSQVFAHNATAGKAVYVTAPQSGTGGKVFQISNAGTNPPTGSITDVTATFGTLNFAYGITGIGTGASPTRLFTTNFDSLNGTNALAFTNAAGNATLLDSGTTIGCSRPGGVHADDNETNVFVACAGTGQVFQRTNTGGQIGTALAFQMPGSSPAASGVAQVPVNRTGGGAIDLRNTVLVADAQNDVVYLLENGTNSPQRVTRGGLASTVGAANSNAVSLPGCVPANMSVADTPGPISGNVSTATVYVACPGNNTIRPITVTAFNAGAGTPGVSLAVGTAINVGTYPYGVAVDATNSSIMVTDSGSDTARVVSPPTSTGTQVVVNVGDVPAGIGFITATPNLAYIVNEGDGSAWIMDPPTPAKGKKAKVARKSKRRVRRHYRRQGRKVARSAQMNDMAKLRLNAHRQPLSPPLP